jgi:hypothetical protein
MHCSNLAQPAEAQRANTRSEAMGYSTPLDPAKYVEMPFKWLPVEVPSEHATKNNVLERFQVIVNDGAVKLYAERRKGDWRVILPNAKIKLCNTQRDTENIVRGILIGWEIPHQA